MSWGCFISLKCRVFIKYTTQRQTPEPVRSHLELCPLITGCHCGSHSRIVMWKSLEKEPMRHMRLTTAERQLQLTCWSALTIESAPQPGSLHLFPSFTMEIYPQIPMEVSSFFLFVLLLSDHLHSQSSKRKRNSETMTQATEQNRATNQSEDSWPFDASVVIRSEGILWGGRDWALPERLRFCWGSNFDSEFHTHCEWWQSSYLSCPPFPR